MFYIIIIHSDVSSAFCHWVHNIPRTEGYIWIVVILCSFNRHYLLYNLFIFIKFRFNYSDKTKWVLLLNNVHIFKTALLIILLIDIHKIQV